MFNCETHDEILARTRRYDLMEEARIARLHNQPQAERPKVKGERFANIAALLATLGLWLQKVR